MALTPSDPDRHRRQQRRRAVIAWAVGLGVVALFVLGAALGGGGSHREVPSVPYGETMTSAQFAQIEEGEEEADVVERLDKAGRPEALTEGYVLRLFPPRPDGVECSYWEFSDEPEVFARLCFSESDTELTEKEEHDVHSGLEEVEGTVTA